MTLAIAAYLILTAYHLTPHPFSLDWWTLLTGIALAGAQIHAYLTRRPK